MAFPLSPTQLANAARQKAGAPLLTTQPIKPVAPTGIPNLSYSSPPVSTPIAPTFTTGHPTAYSPPAPVLKQSPTIAPPPEFKPQSNTLQSMINPGFGPGNNMIGQTIAPAPSGPNSFDTEAAQYARGAGVGDYSAQTQQARDMILAQLQNLQNAPDRFALAQSNYDLFAKNSDPQYQQDLRGVGQKAAALGRIGAGLTTNDLTGVMGQHQNLLASQRQQLLNDALSNTLQDRLNISGALNAGGGLLGGQDLSLNTARSNAALGQAGVFGGLGQNQAQREANAVAQQMQQQQYQANLDQQNIQNQIAQQQLQQAAQNQAWQQQFAGQSLAAQIAAQQNTQYPNIPYPQNPSSGVLGAGSINQGSLGFQGY